MFKESLPIYQIPDFESGELDSSEFYYSRLGRHLKNHKFIQKAHKHDFYILMLFTVGTGNHSIDFQNYKVAPGTVFFLHPGQVHHWHLSEDSDGHILFFSAEFYSFGFPAKYLDRFPFFYASNYPSNLALDLDNVGEIGQLFSAMEKETQMPAWSIKEVLRSYTEILLVKLCRIYKDVNKVEDFFSVSGDQYMDLETVIESNFKEHREASFYAESLNLSAKQLNRLTKSTVGKPISQLLLDRVILESQRLLTYSDSTVAEIAAHLGFEDASYFSRLFRKKIGKTPEQFRKSLH